MKKLVFILFIFFLSAFIISCGTKPTPESQRKYTEEKSTAPASFFSEEYGSLLDSHTTDNGDIYSLYRKKQDEKNLFTVTRKNNNDPIEEVIPLSLDETVHYLFICADSNGNILLADTTALYLFTTDAGSSFLSIPAWAPGGMIITDNNTVICQASSDSPYHLFDLSTGSDKGIFLEKDFLFEQGKCQPFLCGQSGDEMLITSAGLYTHNEVSWTLQVPSRGTSMSKAGFIATGIERKNAETYVVYDAGFQYVYAPKDSPEETEAEPITLRVTAWQNRDTLKTALAEYQIANPHITIEYTYRCDKDSLPETKQEATTLLQITNAEIVSSQAADLYVLDYLPWEKYREKGLLMDLSNIVSPYADNESYFGNILTAYETKEGLYAVPWFFSANYILCRQELTPYIHSIHELAAYLESHPEDPGPVPYYYRDNPKLFLSMMYDFYGNDLFTDGTVTLENVEKFLASCVIIYNRQQENTNATIVPDYYGKKTYDYQSLRHYPCGADIPLLFEEQEGSFLLLPSTPMGISDLLKPYHHPDYDIIPADGIHSQFLFGIHSGTTLREATEDLLKYLLSYFETTGRNDPSLNMFGFLPGLPVYSSLVSKQLEKYVTKELDENNPLYDYTAEDMKNLLSLLGSFEKPGYNADPVTDDMYSIFEDRSIPCLTGEKPLEEVADEVYNGLRLLYYENQ